MDDQVTSLPVGALESNYVPSTAEESLLRNRLIPRYAARLQELDVKIQQMRVLLANLELERREERRTLEAHQALLTPMRRLVPDVLLEIFQWCHARNLASPMRLANVCRQWRQLVLSSPTLWSTVLLHDTMYLEGIVPFTRACIKYSGMCPLKVTVKSLRRRPQSEKYQKAIVEALGLLSAHVHRWELYHIFIDDMYHLIHLYAKLPGVAPLLKELVVLSLGKDGRTSRPAVYTSSDVPLLLQSKMLRRFSIDDGRRSLTLADCWNILHHCSKLQHFEITGIRDAPDMVAQWGKEISLPALQVLCIGPRASDPSQLIHAINTPKLERVQLFTCGSTFDSSCISKLVATSGNLLRNISLVHLDCALFASSLHLLPNLNVLHLVQADGLDILLAYLTKRVNGSFYCPKLTNLDLRLSTCTGGHLVRFVKERRASGIRIRVGVDPKNFLRPKDFHGLSILLYMVEELSDLELKELYDLQTDGLP